METVGRVRIKRERWAGRYYLVARDRYTGRIVTYVRWAPRYARDLYDVVKARLRVTVVEIVYGSGFTEDKGKRRSTQEIRVSFWHKSKIVAREYADKIDVPYLVDVLAQVSANVWVNEDDRAEEIRQYYYWEIPEWLEQAPRADIYVRYEKWTGDTCRYWEYEGILNMDYDMIEKWALVAKG